MAEEFDSQVPVRPITDKRNSGAARARAKASKIKPRALFRGFLAFEDRYGKQREILQQRTGLGPVPGWGTASWASILANDSDGERTLAQIVDDLWAIGIDIDMKRALNLVEYLADIKRLSI